MNNRKNGPFSNSLFYIIILVAMIGVFSYFMGNGAQDGIKDINSSTFISELQKDDVKSFDIQPNNGIYKINGEYRKAKKVKTSGALLQANKSQEVKHFTTTLLQSDAQISEISKLADKNDVKMSALQAPQTSWWVNLLSLFLPIILLFAFFYMMMGQSGQGGQGGRMMNFGKSKAQKADKNANKVRFSDVAGAEEEKQELVEVVEFLKDPRKFAALGARIPAGVLLEGPPGTGKTLLAKAVAGEAGVPFFSISGSDFVEMFVGVGASRVRDLFEQAKKTAPSIIFIDEIDAVGRQRGAGMGGGHDEREQTLNQMLVEMDGFTGNEGVIVIAATNRSDVLDPALLRPGRFDRKILVGRPDVKGREAILHVHAKNKPFADDVDLKVVAQQTPGFVGADLENLLNEAALVAARRNKEIINADDIDEAEDRVIAGPAKRDRAINEKERQTVAYHEAGHAIIGLVLNDSRVVKKVTIVPRGRAGGYAIMLPKDDQFLVSKKELTEQIVGLMGGRTAEEIVFDSQSTGASNDFEQATDIARGMVTHYGMSEKLGMVALEKEGQPFVGAAYGQAPAFSEATASAIDSEIRRLLDEAHQQAHEIIETHRKQHQLIAEMLLKYETLNEKEILSLFNDGKMPDKNQDEFPSEKAATFEEAKKALEKKEAEKQQELPNESETETTVEDNEKTLETTEQSDVNQDDTVE